MVVLLRPYGVVCKCSALSCILAVPFHHGGAKFRQTLDCREPGRSTKRCHYFRSRTESRRGRDTRSVPGLRLPGSPDPCGTAVRSVFLLTRRLIAVTWLTQHEPPRNGNDGTLHGLRTRPNVVKILADPGHSSWGRKYSSWTLVYQ